MSAIISACGKFRHRLERTIDNPDPAGIYAGKVIAFFGINPSTADASKDDATVRKWKGFCQRWGVPHFIVGNVFPYRATDVRELATCENPIENMLTYTKHLKRIVDDADIVVPCWGDSKKVPLQLRHRVAALRRALRSNSQRQNKPLLTFGLTAGGDPMHPLMLSYNTPLIELTT